ncbi:hypothetical protein [uncultured Agrococcus sp.]|uniref:hypothetical protein n=1 Tax=uncultured Agrococcus sp. TaxID=382258 RepID=UPI0025E875B1|nr:hypothetical protein [uncultured Agrococcus sp.]
MTTTSRTARIDRARVLTASILLLAAGAVGSMLLFSDFAFLSENDEFAALDRVSNRPLYTFVVVNSITIAVAAAGVGAVGFAAGRGSAVAATFGRASGIAAAVGAATLVTGQVLLSALANQWMRDETLQGSGNVMNVFTSLQFGTSQMGYGVFAIGLVLLCIAIACSRSMHRYAAIAPGALAIIMLVVVSDGQSTAAALLPICTLLLGAAVLVAGLIRHNPVGDTVTPPQQDGSPDSPPPAP